MTPLIGIAIISRDPNVEVPFFSDNGKDVLILVLILKEATVEVTLTSIKNTTKYNY
jgi:hypothetical protein